MADIDKIKNRLRGLKSWYTKIETACEPYASGAKIGNRNTYEAKQHELTTAKKKIDDALTELLFAANYQEESPEEKEHLARVNEMQTRFDTMMDRLTLKEAEACRSNLAKEESTKKYVKPIFELKPRELSSSSTIDEVEPFIRQFTAFYNASNIELCASYEDQQQYLKNCLDTVLVQHLDTKIDGNTPVIGGANSCVNILRGYYEQKYPLLTRRVEAFALKQPSGVPFLDFYGKAWKIFKAAEIEKLTAEQLKSYLLITATTDAELKKEFLKLKEPDTKALLECARTHVRANQAVAKEHVETFAVTQEKPRTGNSTEYQANMSQLRRLGITCGRCGSKGGHGTWDCKLAKENLVCSNCKSKGRPHTGHVDDTCYDKLGITRSPRSRSASRGRNPQSQRTRSNSRGRPPTYESRTPSPGRGRQSRSRDRFRRRASTPGRGPWGVYQVEERDTSGTSQVEEREDINDDIFMVLETTPQKKSEQNAFHNFGPGDFDNEDPSERVEVPLLSMKVELTTRDNKKATVQANPDSGTGPSLMPLKLAKELGLEELQQGNRMLSAANKSPIGYQGDARLKVDFDGKIIFSNFAVADVTCVLIGRRDLLRLGLIRDDPTEPKCNQIHAVSNEKKQPGKLAAIAEQLKEEYKDVIKDKLPTKPMAGGDVKIILKEDREIVPEKISVPRRTPLHWQKLAKKLVNDLLDAGVIEEVTEVTDWINPAFFVDKPGTVPQKIRLVTDYKKLNSVVQRPIHPFPTPANIIESIEDTADPFYDTDNIVYCKMDLVHGYFQMSLDERSSYLTTFLLEWGKYRYLRCPMGLVNSSDDFCQRTDSFLSGLQNTLKLVDDILTWARSAEELKQRIKEILERLRSNNVTVSASKFVINRKVKFAGFIFEGTKVRPDPERLKGIDSFASPKDRTELKSFLGAVNQLSIFVPDLTYLTSYNNKLLKKEASWIWTPDHEAAFRAVKKAIKAKMELSLFDRSAETRLLCDASKLKGLGFALIQVKRKERNHQQDTRLIQCGSRSLSPAEKNYAIIELEALAISFGLKKCCHYLAGNPRFQVVTDHRPLLGIWTKPLSELGNQRLLKIVLSTTDYSFDLTYLEGKTHFLADLLSRSVEFSGPNKEEIVNAVVTATVADPKLEGIKAAATDDEQYQKIIEAWKSGAEPQSLESSHPAKIYTRCWNEMALYEDLLTLNDKIVVPQAFRRTLTKLLHLSHQGQKKTLKAASQLYSWPTMNADIIAEIGNCKVCLEHSDSQQKEPEQQMTAKNPFDQVGLDLFELKGKSYIILGDRYSGYPMYRKLAKVATCNITSALEDVTMEYGNFLSCVTDNGPQFRAPFTQWCREHGIVHIPASPYMPKSNGLAEATVKSVKKLLAKYDGKTSLDFKKGLRELRNLPRADGFSPAQMFFGRRQRTELPALPSHYKEIDQDEAATARQETRKKEKKACDCHAKRLPPLARGQTVVIQDPQTKKWDKQAVVMSKRHTGKSYVLRCEDGKMTIRNRVYLKRARPDKKTDFAKESMIAAYKEEDPPAGILKGLHETGTK